MEGRKLLDIRSDIYSLGILMYQMLCGKHPFQLKSNSFGEWYQAHRFETPLLLNEMINEANVPVELENLVMSCLAKEIKNRPENITEVLEKLELIQRQFYQITKNDDKHISELSVDITPLKLTSKNICLQKNGLRISQLHQLLSLIYYIQYKGKFLHFGSCYPRQRFINF